MNGIQLGVLRRFKKLGVRYLVVGGRAMLAYGIDRATRDLDLWVARDAENAAALAIFLQRVQNAPPLDRLQQPNLKLCIPHPHMPEVDILTSVAGDPPFDEAYARRDRLQLDGNRTDVVSPADLIAIKEAAAAQQEADAASGTLGAAELKAATGTAQKERRDLVLLRMWIGASS